MTNTYLGIDFGLAHLGLAVSDHMLATPLPPLPNNVQLLSRLSSLLTTHHITHIVVGLPSGPVEPAARQFAADLSRQSGLPVILHDETLSTRDARALLAAIGASRAKKRADHSYAAALILEDYLESVKLNQA